MGQGIYRRRRLVTVLLASAIVLAGFTYDFATQPSISNDKPSNTKEVLSAQSANAQATLNKLEIKGRAPKSGYKRTNFSDGWAVIGSCSVRELVLKRDLTDTRLAEDGCKVLSGALDPDPYTGKRIDFQRGPTSSQAVQIDHVVAVSDAWQKGAQQLTSEKKHAFYNDSLNLLAVDGPTNNKKGDGDAATWLPPNKAFRCRYVARQIAVKYKYNLWVTQTEHDAISRVLTTCPEQILPIEQ